MSVGEYDPSKPLTPPGENKSGAAVFHPQLLLNPPEKRTSKSRPSRPQSTYPVVPTSILSIHRFKNTWIFQPQTPQSADSPTKQGETRGPCSLMLRQTPNINAKAKVPEVVLLFWPTRAGRPPADVRGLPQLQRGDQYRRHQPGKKAIQFLETTS